MNATFGTPDQSLQHPEWQESYHKSHDSNPKERLHQSPAITGRFTEKPCY
ncbi:hypothetical protein [Rhodohalobacter sp. SW132]|nr:hypothetical protein [Rhodohalobacter sp. SW132]